MRHLSGPHNFFVFFRAGCRPGQTILVHGASGGVRIQFYISTIVLYIEFYFFFKLFFSNFFFKINEKIGENDKVRQ